ncbi:CCT domain containing protein [Trema orientale]|uniref:CCT domain containing protein n=1 Tax=Trema orientale TaxID=63057 RepID=A0A2P5F495_TREOI|nr:CCT domain containing protein [Trema orientale]
MSSCLSGGGGRPYAFEFEIVKSPSTTSTRNSNASSSPPSSTLSESSNSGLAITTRKPRTPRKRPNQTYNEAAALLSTAYPSLFSAKQLSNPGKFTKLPSPFDEPAELLFPFRVFDDDSSCFLPHHHHHHHHQYSQKPGSAIEPKLANSSCHSPGEFDSRPNSNCDSELMDLGETHTSSGCAYPDDDFDAESMLDEEIDAGGIDSIMGNVTVDTEAAGGGGGGFCYGYPMGLGFGGRFELGLGMRRGVGGIRALRHVDEGNWWNFPTVDVMELSPKFRKEPAPEKKKKKKAVVMMLEKKEKEKEKAAVVESKSLELVESGSKPSAGLSLKLNYDDVLSAWSDKGSPFSEDAPPGTDSPGNDVSARLAQIDLFPEAGGVREASVMRYKEKRRTRLFSKKIRYQVRKVNADRRPRMKGRFVRRPNSKHEL